MSAPVLKLVREQDGAMVANPLRLADTFLRRFRGLMLKAPLEPAEGLWIEPCSSIHMMFMRFRIDVLFLSRLGGRWSKPVIGSEGEVLKICRGVRPWIGMASCRGASTTVELSAGRADEVGLEDGDMLRLEAT